MSAPISPIPRSPTMRFQIEAEKDDTEWCINTSDAKAHEKEEPAIDLLQAVEDSYSNDEMQAMAELAEKQNAWINEMRAKQFRHVINPRLKLKTEGK